MIFEKIDADVMCDYKADGRIMGYPYRTDLASKDGVNIHLWVGGRRLKETDVKDVIRTAKNIFDVVSASYSFGKPRGFYEPRQNIKDASFGITH